MQPFACLGPYLRAVMERAEERGLPHLAAFAREQWERHVYGGVYEVSLPKTAVVPVPACKYCEELT